MSGNAGSRADAASQPLAAGFALPARIVSFPLVTIRGYPFIEAEVNGVRGKLMLDTGARAGLILNDHRIPLPGAHVIGTNNFGSGQRFVQRENGRIASVNLANSLHYLDVTNVESQDATQLEHITPDFLGWIGYDFFKAHTMELDYRRSIVTFKPLRDSLFSGRMPRGYAPLFTIHFEIRRLPNHPIVRAIIGREPFMAAFDTGQYGTIYADDVIKARLIETGAVTTPLGTDDDASTTIIRWSLDGHMIPAIPAVGMVPPPFAAAKGMGLTESAIVTIGYGLLHRYRTVWNWSQGEIAFYAR